MNKFIQAVFFLVALVFTFLNVNERFFSKKVRINDTISRDLTYIIKTTVTYQTRKLSEIDFPMFISLFSTPGYDITSLRNFGFKEVMDFFSGKIKITDDTTHFYWGNETFRAEGEKNKGLSDPRVN